MCRQHETLSNGFNENNFAILCFRAPFSEHVTSSNKSFILLNKHKDIYAS